MTLFQVFVPSGIASFITNTTLGAFVYLKNRGNPLNRFFGIFALSLGCWSVGSSLENLIPDPVLALRVLRKCYVFAAFLPSFFLHFACILTGTTPLKRILLRLSYCGSILFALGTFGDFFIQSLRQIEPYGFRISQPGPMYYVFFVYFSSVVSGVLWLFYRAAQTSTGLRKIQLSYIFLAHLLAATAGVDYFLAVFRIVDHVPVDDYILVLYFLFFGYAIARYRLMDINVVITRTAVFTVVYALLLGLPLGGAVTWQPELERALGPKWWVWAWLGGAGLTTVAHYVNLYWQRRAEARLLKEQRRYQNTLLRASQGMTQIRELKRLLNLIVYIITKAVKLTHAAVFLENTHEGGAFVLSAARNRQWIESSNRVSSDDQLIELLRHAREPLVREELASEVGGEPTRDAPTFRKARAVKQMEALNASVVVPSFRENHLIGFVVLGEKQRGQIFTTEDLVVFSTLANQAAVAIENARFYEEEKQRQAALFHAATLASLGTMASSMGHQVNNRFNVVSVVSSSQKYKLKQLLENGASDPAKLRQALQECHEQFASLEEEAIRGGKIVASIRKLARPSTEGHRPLQLTEAIKAGVDVVQHKIKLDQVDFEVNVPEDLPLIEGDLSQMGECFLNFVDNAYDAIKTREQLINEGKLSYTGTKPYRGMIQITAALKDPDTVWLDVADTGIGLEPEQVSKLFVPFYTTKATAEKGTGLGLYVIKKIIEAHRGTITLHSTYGQGTVFTIELPAATEVAKKG